MEQDMNNGLRNTLIGAIVTIVISFLGAWIQVNNRISVLEVQMDNFMHVQQQNDADMTKLLDKVNDVQTKVTKLNVEFELVHRSGRGALVQNGQ